MPSMKPPTGKPRCGTPDRANTTSSSSTLCFPNSTACPFCAGFVEQRSPSLVLLLTAKDTAQDKITGLEMGADDYLVKPFVFAELLARVKALIRRKYDTKSTILRIADLEVDVSGRCVRRGGKPVDLSGREYALLEYLAHNAGRIVSRTDIWQHVYDFNASPESNVVDVYIGLLRKKIERTGKPRLIHTRRGQGYLLAEMEQR